MDAYEITRQVVGDGVIRLALKGEFDFASVDELRAALGRAIEEDHAVGICVDLDKATFIDSETISVLMWGHRTAHNAKAQLTLINPHGLVRRVLRLAGVWQRIGSADVTP